ncbi:hypothetical protein BS628_10405 [Agrobacterium radiobacter]|nr:hypothetical protein FHL81_18085 [Agrobacterium tumefaciens]KWT75055.1 hypothetical protein ASH09_20010 [Agrobacterium radiobacter]TGE77236.1 hypothetical protein C9410_22150 [Rhizobium sp. SEMIA 439]KAB0457492.1 hypothetical protein F7R04_23410 [Agrobacterium tumefaciens]MQB26684.1 hypothetical protein [Agrobacterium tumefaciens]
MLAPSAILKILKKLLKTDRRRQRVLRPPLVILSQTISSSQKLLWPYFQDKTGNMNFYFSDLA